MYLAEAWWIVACCWCWLFGQSVGYAIGRWARREADERRVPIAWGGLYEQEKRWKNSERVRFQDVMVSPQLPGRYMDVIKYSVHADGKVHQQPQKKGLLNSGTTVHLTRPQKVALCALILNSRMTRHGLPMSDVPLTLPALAAVGIGRKAGDRIRAEVVDLRLGWRDDAGTVYLNRHKAREFVEKARRAKVIGE